MEISRYLVSNFRPTMCPPKIADKIVELLAKLHMINYFSLTYTNRPQRSVDMLNGVEALLADPNISDRYRRALEFKREV